MVLIDQTTPQLHWCSAAQFTLGGSNAGLKGAVAAHPDKINFQDADGKTALMACAHMGHVQKLKVLLAGGADTMIKDKAGRTCLHWAAEGVSNADTVTALLAGAKDKDKLCNAKDSSGVRAATRAKIRGERKLAELMTA